MEYAVVRIYRLHIVVPVDRLQADRLRAKGVPVCSSIRKAWAIARTRNIELQALEESELPFEVEEKES